MVLSPNLMIYERSRKYQVTLDRAHHLRRKKVLFITFSYYIIILHHFPSHHFSSSSTKTMSSDRLGSASISARSLGDISEFSTTRIGLDIISAVRRNLGFLRTVADSHWLHSEPTITEAIRRSNPDYTVLFKFNAI